MNASLKKDLVNLASSLHYTRLRDFGAFQAHASTLVTREVAAIAEDAPEDACRVYDVWEAPTNKLSAYPRQQASQKQATAGESQGQDTGVPLPLAVARSPQSYPKRLQAFRGHGRGDHEGRPEESTKKPGMKKRIQFLMRIAITLLLFVFLFKSFSWPALFGLLGSARRAFILIGLIIGASGVVISSYQWRGLLESEHIRFDLADLIDLYLVSTAFSHFLPTGMGGDAVKALYVGRQAGNTEGATSAAVMSRVTGFFGMLAIAIVMLIVWHSHFSAGLVTSFALLSLLVGGMIFGAILSVTLLPKIVRARFIASYLAGHRLLERMVASIMRVGNGLKASMRRPRALLIATLFGVLFWVIACLNYYSYAVALGVTVPLYFYFVAIPLVSLVTFLPISINGFGVRESTFIYLFATMHVSTASSLLIVLLMDAQVIFFGAIGGCIYFMLTRKNRGALYQAFPVVGPDTEYPLMLRG